MRRSFLFWYSCSRDFSSRYFFRSWSTFSFLMYSTDAFNIEPLFCRTSLTMSKYLKCGRKLVSKVFISKISYWSSSFGRRVPSSLILSLILYLLLRSTEKQGIVNQWTRDAFQNVKCCRRWWTTFFYRFLKDRLGGKICSGFQRFSFFDRETGTETFIVPASFFFSLSPSTFEICGKTTATDLFC